MITHEFRIDIPGHGSVSALWSHPENAHTVLVLAHGAGAGMRHAFMEEISGALSELGIATLRYQFPYMESGGKRPDRPAVAHAAVAAAVKLAAELGQGLPVIAGGKSFGGRMSSQAAAEGMLPEIRGLVFLGFPLHPPGRPGTERAAHLTQVRVPMLFLQGTRDTLADLNLVSQVTDDLDPSATLHVVDGGDHSFKVLKRSGRNQGEVMAELVSTIDQWIGQQGIRG